MRRRLLVTTMIAGSLGLVLHDARAQPSAPTDTSPAAQAAAPVAAPVDCSVNPDPYKNYACLDAYLGTDIGQRLFNYYKLEWGEAVPPADPNAPPGRRADWPTTPQTTPPMPFTEWPYGGATLLGVNRTGSVDSPLMTAIANTSFGQWLNDTGIQVYGWFDPGFNVSTNAQRPGGNSPISYTYVPNTVQLDQAVLYIERTPDTVQTDHVDWGFRLSAIYGVDYRYTTAYGLFSYQYLKHNNENGYDFPMVYGELYVPQVAQGMIIRVGRYISLPDIEAQLAPNNYMYTHSLTYSFDNYTNEGIQTTTAITKDLLFQLGVTDGTEAAIWHLNQTRTNLYPNTPSTPNPLYPGTTFKTDPGAQPSVTVCVRYSWNDEHDNVQPCANGINRGVWGYNNLQWYGVTYYHKFSDHWHLSTEFYDEYQDGVPNAKNPLAQTIFANGGTPFSPQYLRYNQPGLAQCSNATVLRCRATAIGAVAYLNYSPDALNNFSFRPEYYADDQGQRTGVAADYYEFSLGWQHWFSPQIEVRPEIGYYRSINAYAFNGNPTRGIAPNRNSTVIAAGDLIFHF